MQHYSDCTLHNEPAHSAGPCNCGGYALSTFWSNYRLIRSRIKAEPQETRQKRLREHAVLRLGPLAPIAVLASVASLILAACTHSSDDGFDWAAASKVVKERMAK